jgi:hypothetical protein
MGWSESEAETMSAIDVSDEAANEAGPLGKTDRKTV